MDKERRCIILERDFQKTFIAKVKKILPNCIVLKNDSKQLQGIPDWLITDEGIAMFFEIKVSQHATRQPNQEYYIDYINEHNGYARFVYPENMEEILNEIQRTFGA